MAEIHYFNGGQPAPSQKPLGAMVKNTVQDKKLMSTKSKDNKDFEKEYQKTEKEVLVLTSDLSGGAVRIGNSWQSLEHILAYIDLETSELKQGEGQITWLITEKQSSEFGISWPYNFKKGTIYRLIVRELKDKTVPEGYLPSIANRLMIVRLIEENTSNKELEEILIEYRKPTIIVDKELGEFKLNKDLRIFEGKVIWLKKEVQTFLEVTVNNKSSWTKAMNVLRKLMMEPQQLDLELKKFVAEQLIDGANKWQLEAKLPKLTKNNFIKRISLSSLSVKPSGNFEFYYDDDNIFWGHTIRIEGNIRTGIKNADIVG